LRILARLKPAVVYQALLRAAADTLLALGKTRKGLTFGLTPILHTWTRELAFHPHVHVLVSAGGVAQKGGRFIQLKNTATCSREACWVGYSSARCWPPMAGWWPR